MATKCVAQIPVPADTPVRIDQLVLRSPRLVVATEYVMNVVSAVLTQTTAARATSQ